MALPLDADTLLDQLTTSVEQTIAREHGEHLTMVGEGIWRETPVDLDTFVESAEHLHLPPLFARQRNAVLSLLGEDPKRIFEEPTPAETRPPAWRQHRSTNVRASAHTREHGLLIEYTDGTVYSYPTAEKSVHQALVAAKSPGRFVQAAVKGKFDHARLDVAADEVRTRTAQRSARQYQIGVCCWGKGCMLGNMRLTMPDGRRVPIKDVADPIPVVAYHEDDDRLITANASAPWKAGRGESYRVTLGTGRVVDVYAGHQFLTRARMGHPAAGPWATSWQQLRNLDIGAPIALPAKTGCPGATHAPAEARLLGYIIGDGSATATNAAPKLKAHRDEAGDVRATIEAVTGRPPSEWADRNAVWFGFDFKPWETRRGGNPAYELCKRARLVGCNARTKRIPDECFTYDEASTLELLSGLIQTDGWVSPNSPEGRTWEVGYSTVSEQLARDVLELLQRVGVVAKLTHKRTQYRGADYFSWAIKVHQRHQVIRLLEGLRLAGTKAARAEQGLAALRALPVRSRGLRTDGAIVWDRIASVEPLGEHDYYDIEVPGPENYAAEGMLHHNSGKDYLCSIVVAYLVHVLLCLRDPQGYFGLAPGENIDIVNVAYSADQAKKVFFLKFKQRIGRWRWLRQRFDVIEGGARRWKENKGLPTIEINDQDVVFPRMIRCFSRHSANESYEGLNIVAWVMDEASAFLSPAKRENANAIYQTLRTSAGSRFQRRWVGMIISYPRHADDFTMTKVAEAKKHPEAGIYADGPAATWEVNEMLGRGDWVEVRPGVRVPVELANDFILDFDEAMAKFMALPPLAKDALIKDAERVWAAVRKGRAPLIEWEPQVNRRSVTNGEGEEVDREFAAVKLTRLGTLPKGARLFFHGDPSRSSDAFGLGFAHGVPATIMLNVPAGEVLTERQIAAANAGEAERAAREGRDPRLIGPDTLVPWERDVTKTVVDALIVWRPDPRRNRHVDLLNVRETILAIIDRYGRGAIGAGSFDQYDSAETCQVLQAKKIPFENEAWPNSFQHRIYRGARAAFYNDLVELPDHPAVTSEDPSAPGAIYELLRVEEIDGHKIDHPDQGSKDLSDVVARLIEHVTGQLKRSFSFGRAGADQAAGVPRARSTGPRVDPASSPSPVTAAMRTQDEQRATERPVGVIDQAAGTVTPEPGSKFSFGVAR